MVDVEITKYVPAWFSFRIEYSSDATWGIICGFIISGGLFSIIFFSLCVLLSYLSRKVLKGFPNVLYRCIANFGIAMIFEPLITFIQSILIYAIEDDIN